MGSSAAAVLQQPGNRVACRVRQHTFWDGPPFVGPLVMMPRSERSSLLVLIFCAGAKALCDAARGLAWPSTS